MLVSRTSDEQHVVLVGPEDDLHPTSLDIASVRAFLNDATTGVKPTAVDVLGGQLAIFFDEPSTERAREIGYSLYTQLSSFSLGHYQNSFHIVDEMLAAINIIRDFDPLSVKAVADGINTPFVTFVGAGSSYRFPVGIALARVMQLPEASTPLFFGLGGNEAKELHLKNKTVVGISNSGRTKEVCDLFDLDSTKLPHTQMIAITPTPNSALGERAFKTILLDCGEPEQATAATKSVVAQALAVQSLIAHLANDREFFQALPSLAEQFEAALTQPIDRRIGALLGHAKHIYFCGARDGVAEELSLKAMEILKCKSSYEPSSDILHGSEEVMNQDNDVIVLVSPSEQTLRRAEELFTVERDIPVIAITDLKTSLPRLHIGRSTSIHSPYCALAAGWAALIAGALAAGIDPDKTKYARKIGNEIKATK